MIIEEVTPISPQILDFQKKEWTNADTEHYGIVIDWKKEKKTLVTKDNEKTLGVLELLIQAGVMHIETLIVAHEKQGQGIGKALMQKAEQIAQEYKLHKIYLETGKTWYATKFYEALGYTKTADLPKHFVKSDYVIYSKFLS
jgi:ribosomal protein S18 acetylase RimI-like enzyme